MEDTLAAGIEFIVWLQQYRTPGLDHFFEVFTNFGGRYYLYLFPALFWCVDYRTGVRVIPIFAFTLFLNSTLKDWIAQPRPFQMDPRVISPGEQGYGLPSGHAQLVVVFWGVIASWVARPWFWGVSVVVMLLMGFSRIYLGVHFPSDVVGAWLLGALTLIVMLRTLEPIEAWLRGLGLAGQVGLSLGAGIFVLLFDALLVDDPLNQGIAGFIAGAGAGAAIAHRHLHFDGRGPWWERALRYALGTSLMLILIGAFQRMGAPEGFAGALVIALDLAMLGLWLTLIAPWLFQLSRLSSASQLPPASDPGPGAA